MVAWRVRRTNCKQESAFRPWSTPHFPRMTVHALARAPGHEVPAMAADTTHLPMARWEIMHSRPGGAAIRQLPTPRPPAGVCATATTTTVPRATLPRPPDRRRLSASHLNDNGIIRPQELEKELACPAFDMVVDKRKKRNAPYCRVVGVLVPRIFHCPCWGSNAMVIWSFEAIGDIGAHVDFANRPGAPAW